mmetsp:Transcript_68410/g.182301  ORF Transcript_68410/g.182301 Transcript_68410/m.182301 type:complete len:210 (-) Transcript_68410:7-636(-)
MTFRRRSAPCPGRPSKTALAFGSQFSGFPRHTISWSAAGNTQSSLDSSSNSSTPICVPRSSPTTATGKILSSRHKAARSSQSASVPTTALENSTTITHGSCCDWAIEDSSSCNCHGVRNSTTRICPCGLGEDVHDALGAQLPSVKTSESVAPVPLPELVMPSSDARPLTTVAAVLVEVQQTENFGSPFDEHGSIVIHGRKCDAAQYRTS